MTRLESVAWALAGGGATLFVLSAVLKGQSWAVAFVAIVVAVAAWSWRAPVVAGMALGVIGWLMVTGIDLNPAGELRVSGWADVVRLGILVGVAPVGAVVRLGTRSWRQSRDSAEVDEPGALIWAAPHRLIDNDASGVRVPSGVSDGGRHSRPAVATPHMDPELRGRRSRPDR